MFGEINSGSDSSPVLFWRQMKKSAERGTEISYGIEAAFFCCFRQGIAVPRQQSPGVQKTHAVEPRGRRESAGLKKQTPEPDFFQRNGCGNVPYRKIHRQILTHKFQCRLNSGITGGRRRYRTDPAFRQLNKNSRYKLFRTGKCKIGVPVAKSNDPQEFLLFGFPVAKREKRFRQAPERIVIVRVFAEDMQNKRLR